MALPLSIATAAIIYIFPAIVDKPEKLIPLLDIISVGIYEMCIRDSPDVDPQVGHGRLCCRHGVSSPLSRP